MVVGSNDSPSVVAARGGAAITLLGSGADESSAVTFSQTATYDVHSIAWWIRQIRKTRLGDNEATRARDTAETCDTAVTYR